LFEIIYPENRIVVNYGDYEGLVLLDVIDNATGFSDTDEFDNCAWSDKVARIPMNRGFDSGQVVDISPGEEGFVYLWPTRNFRTKMKSAEYIELHRLVTGLNQKVVWKALVEGKTIAQICEHLPDEFHGMVEDWADALIKPAVEKMTEVLTQYVSVINALGTDHDRAAYAKYVQEHYPDNARYLFGVADGRSVFDMALKANKPRIVKEIVE
jgi:RNA ligase